MTVTIIGLGLIGGSFSLAMQEAGLAERVIGVDQNPDHAQQALALGIAHEITSLEEGIRQADLVILAIPVQHSKHLLGRILELMPVQGTLIDMGSTKEKLCAAVEAHPNRGRYVAAHPMAGTEYSGPQAAFASLYHGKRVIICEAEKSDADALGQASRLFSSLNMRISFMDARSHDKHAAYISHLSHITSFTLGLTVLDAEKDESNILDMASSGFASTVRLAKSAPSMWTPIFLENKAEVLAALSEYQTYLSAFKQAIDSEDESKLSELMQRANDIGKIL